MDLSDFPRSFIAVVPLAGSRRGLERGQKRDEDKTGTGTFIFGGKIGIKRRENRRMRRRPRWLLIGSLWTVAAIALAAVRPAGAGRDGQPHDETEPGRRPAIDPAQASQAGDAAAFADAQPTFVVRP